MMKLYKILLFVCIGTVLLLAVGGCIFVDTGSGIAKQWQGTWTGVLEGKTNGTASLNISHNTGTDYHLSLLLMVPESTQFLTSIKFSWSGSLPLINNTFSASVKNTQNQISYQLNLTYNGSTINGTMVSNSGTVNLNFN